MTVGNSLNLTTPSNVVVTNTSGIPITSTSLPSAVTLNGGTIATTASSIFTPGLDFGGDATGITFTVQQGYYTTVGNILNFNIYMLLSSKGAMSGVARLNGMPVATRNSGQTDCLFPVLIGVGSGLPAGIVGLMIPNSTIMLLQTQGAVNINSLDNTNFTNVSEIFVSGSYLI